MCTHHDGYLNPTNQSEQERNGLTRQEQGLCESSREQEWGWWRVELVAEEQGLRARGVAPGDGLFPLRSRARRSPRGGAGSSRRPA